MSRLPPELRSRFLKSEIWGFVDHDQKPIEYVVFDPACQPDKIHAVNGFLVIPSTMAQRLPDPTRVITLPGERSTGGWLLSDLAPPDYTGKVLVGALVEAAKGIAARVTGEERRRRVQSATEGGPPDEPKSN